ncbi:MAG: UvrD-helicase domain-containing protein [bacterium]|nr:UvrD-helicase domain-containing protein [bacterium]
MNDLLSSLNSAQNSAVTAPDGPVLVVAGAGSGKTRVLTTRVAWLLAEKGVHPGEIMAFTFTNRAAKEMRERVSQTVGEDRAPFWIGTFHSTGLKILRADGQAIGVKKDFSIYDTDDTRKLIKHAMAELKIDPKQFTPQGTLSTISKWKNDDTDPVRAKASATTFIEEKYAALYEAYENSLNKANALDFDDLILRTVQLLEKDDEVREKYARRFRHVMVDEFQDTNPLQMVFVKLLTTHHGNLFVVGDDDQSIYSWRGAKIENMLKFEEYFPGALTFRLEQNYRSSGNILKAANEVIANNKKRKGKNLWTSDGDGDLLTEEEFHDDEDEAARLVDIVRAETSTGGLSHGDITVLYRTNAQSRVLEDALRRAHIAYQVVGSLHFYDRREVRDVMGYLKLIANPADTISALRVINVPKRKIGKTTVDRLMELALREEMTLGEAAAEPGLMEQQIAPAACKRVRDFFQMITRWRMRLNENVSIMQLVEMVTRDIGFESYLEADDPETAGARGENVAELLNAAGSFDEASAGGTLVQFLEQVALVADPDKISTEEGVVRLMTIHTAKGLEFPVVVLAGVEDDIMPHINSHDDESNLEEERRLLYVAITRAEKRAYLLHAARRRRFGTWQDSLPSRFLTELPDELVERRHLDKADTAPVSQSLFGGSTYGTGYGQKKQPQGKMGKSTWSANSGNARSYGTQSNGASASVSPNQWGNSNKPKRDIQKTEANSWDNDVSQDSGFYSGQLVSHGIFGSGKVVRVEGSGEDMMVTVDFFQEGQKNILPKFTTLIPLD